MPPYKPKVGDLVSIDGYYEIKYILPLSKESVVEINHIGVIIPDDFLIPAPRPDHE